MLETRSFDMKKDNTIIIFIVLIISAASTIAMPPNHYGGRSTVSTGMSYNNSVRVHPQAQPVNKIIIAPPAQGVCKFVPPPPPPKRAVYRYSDFGGNRQFHRRSYYIPSYCMPETGFYNYNNNPFCTQYRPYGSNFYLGF